MAELIVYATLDQPARWAWKFDMSEGMTEAWWVLVYAQTGQTLNSINRVIHRNVSGSGVDLLGVTRFPSLLFGLPCFRNGEYPAVSNYIMRVHISIRGFRLADYDAVFRLWRRSKGVGLNESDSRAGIAAYLRRNPGLSFVAVKAGRIVGAVLCGHDGRRGYLQHLAVAKRYRRCGVGLRLVKACLTKLRAQGFHKCNIFVYADNVAGQEFWQHNDWQLRADLRLMQIELR